MQEQEIIALFIQVGTDLQEIGVKKPIRLLLIGGAYMITQMHNRTITGDIDAVLLGRDRWGEEYNLFKRMMEMNLAEIGGEAS